MVGIIWLGKKKEENGTVLENWIHIDPNDKRNHNVLVDGIDVKNQFKQVLLLYKETMRKWTQGTGGGPGAPENYSNWNIRENEKFSKWVNTSFTWYLNIC